MVAYLVEILSLELTLFLLIAFMDGANSLQHACVFLYFVDSTFFSLVLKLQILMCNTDEVIDEDQYYIIMFDIRFDYIIFRFSLRFFSLNVILLLRS